MDADTASLNRVDPSTFSESEEFSEDFVEKLNFLQHIEDLDAELFRTFDALKHNLEQLEKLDSGRLNPVDFDLEIRLSDPKTNKSRDSEVYLRELEMEEFPLDEIVEALRRSLENKKEKLSSLLDRGEYNLPE